jgi:DNA-binding CsgD family transcriptional regulator
MKNSDIAVIVESGLMQLAFRHILKNVQPDISVLFNTNLEDCLNGKICPKSLIIDSKLIAQPICYTLEKLRKKNPEGEVLIVETSAIDDSVFSYVNDVISKTDTEEIIARKINSFLSVSVAAKGAKHDDTISDREKEIVRLVAMGKTNKEISEALFISPHTVITHRKNITAKLGIKTIAGLTVYAILNRLIDKEEM